ncbi:hypothetical protein Tco_1455673 [Tanacetum coccineum]
MSSDSASSEVTYTSISSHGYPLAWAVDFFRLQELDSPEVALASPTRTGPEETEQAPLSPDYVPGPEEDPERIIQIIRCEGMNDDDDYDDDGIVDTYSTAGDTEIVKAEEPSPAHDLLGLESFFSDTSP